MNRAGWHQSHQGLHGNGTFPIGWEQAIDSRLRR